MSLGANAMELFGTLNGFALVGVVAGWTLRRHQDTVGEDSWIDGDILWVIWMCTVFLLEHSIYLLIVRDPMAPGLVCEAALFMGFLTGFLARGETAQPSL